MGLALLGSDALALFLTGGAANTEPDDSLGGAISSDQVRGLGAIHSNPIPGIRVDNVMPACGEGTATLAVDSNGDLVFTPPGGAPGTPVSIASGQSRVVSGADLAKAVVVFRESVLLVSGISTIRLAKALNGVLGMKNVSDAQRQAGITTYRAIALKSQGPKAVQDMRLWLPPVSGAQATYSIALETPSGGSIQTIVDETTAPTALTFATPLTEASGLFIAAIASGDFIGLWLRKVFPVGTVADQEDFRLAIKYFAEVT